MNPMLSAPKDRIILLLLCGMQAHGQSYWPATWSHISNDWAVHTPFVSEGKIVKWLVDSRPIGWMDMPNTGEAALKES